MGLLVQVVIEIGMHLFRTEHAVWQLIYMFLMSLHDVHVSQWESSVAKGVQTALSCACFRIFCFGGECFNPIPTMRADVV